jgi:hypothetical protein
VSKWLKSLEETAATPIPRSNYVERSHSVCNDLRDISMQLHSLAKAHGRLGMHAISDELRDMAERLTPAEETIRAIVGDIVNERLAEAKGTSAAILRMALGKVDGS